MNILGIMGSPRIGGNTDILLSKVLEAAKEKGAKTEKVELARLKFSPCLECDGLRDDGTCIVEDDMQLLYKKIEAADVIVLASPIFFGSITAQTKMMIDRFQCIWRAKYILGKDIFKKNKRGYFFSVEGSTKKDFFENAKSIVKNFFATIDADYKGELFCTGIDGKASILKQPEILKKAYDSGQAIVSG